MVLLDQKLELLKKDFSNDYGYDKWIATALDFYANDNRQTLTSDNGLDIGPNHKHGGVSAGAIGFDAFFPKRSEMKYKK